MPTLLRRPAAICTLTFHPPTPPIHPPQLVVKAIQSGDATVLQDARRIAQYSEGERVDDAKALAGRLFTTVYMGTVNSSKETRDRCVKNRGARRTTAF